MTPMLTEKFDSLDDAKYASRKYVVVGSTNEATKKSDGEAREPDEKNKQVATKKAPRKRSKPVKSFKLSYDACLAVHKLWMDYMSELLGPSPQDVHGKLLKADLVGSILTVKYSKNPSLVGQAGVVVQETKQAFKIINERSIVKVLPKKASIFTLAIDIPESSTTIEIFGEQFLFNSIERVNKKFKGGGKLSLM